MPKPDPKPMPHELVTAIQKFRAICKKSGKQSQCFEWGSLEYKHSVMHFLASSSEVPQLAVQPGTVEDLCAMMNVLRECRVPFAVKGGGHGMAPGYSSTVGIQISMSRFDQVEYNPELQEVEIGAGCLWDQVYRSLAKTGRNVVGGASKEGVGVAGWLLGGGYSLGKTNRYGLGIDNIVGFQIVTPDGEAHKVSATENPELYNALRGGSNNFGIVTSFTLKTYPQTDSWGARLVFLGNREEEVKNALVEYVTTEKRREAAALIAFRHIVDGGSVEYNISAICFFDAPRPAKMRDRPFKAFYRLQEGEAWAGDLLDWQRGQVEKVSDEHLNPIPNLKTKAAEQPLFNEVSFSSLQSAAFANTNHPPNSQFSITSKAASITLEDETPQLQATLISSSAEQNENELDRTADGQDELELDESTDESEFDPNDGDAFRTIPARELYGEPDVQVFTSADGTTWEIEFDREDDGSPRERGDEDGGIAICSANMTYCAPQFSNLSVVERKSANESLPVQFMETQHIDRMGELPDRGRFGCVMITEFTKPLLDVIAEEAKKTAGHLKSHRGLSIVLDAWPAHSAVFDESAPGAAWPHKRGQPFSPMLAYFRWKDAADDAFWIAELKGTLNRIRKFARDNGLSPRNTPYYNNLCLESVPAYKIYRENLGWLKEVKQKYDPTNVMGLCGGHKIPLPGGPEVDDDSDDEGLWDC